MRTSVYFYNIKEEVFYRTLGLYAALTRNTYVSKENLYPTELRAHVCVEYTY